MGSDILIDGYNVIKNNPMFQSLETKSLADARNLLVRQLKNRYRCSTQRVIVVFDGNGKQEQVSHDEHIRIVFSRYGETADSVIARLAVEAKKAGREVELYSDDREVQRNVTIQSGGNEGIRTTQQLVIRLNAAPRDVELRARHRQEVRRIYGIDSMYKVEDEEDSQPKGRQRRRKSSRHQGRRK